MTLKGVHIAIDLRENYPGQSFKETNWQSNNPDFLWGYYGEFAHTHLGLGHRDFLNIHKRNMNKEDWKKNWSNMRAFQTEESRAEKFFNKSHPELNP